MHAQAVKELLPRAECGRSEEGGRPEEEQGRRENQRVRRETEKERQSARESAHKREREGKEWGGGAGGERARERDPACRDSPTGKHALDPTAAAQGLD